MLVGTWGCWGSGTPGGDVRAPCPAPTPGPVHLVHLAVPGLPPFVMNCHVVSTMFL